jgi:hypothetical protein
MSAVRTFVRLAITGFIVTGLAAACTVNSTGGDDDDDSNVTCDPGAYKDCTCADGADGTKKCNSAGDGYAACVCQAGSGGANAGGEGATPTAGTTNTGGSSGSTNYGGENAGGVDGVDGTAGASGSAGAGGSGEDDKLPLECQDPMDNCEICYFGGCCAEYAPCVNDANEKCLVELAEVLACTGEIKKTRDVKPADLEACAQQVGGANGSWSASLSPLTVDVVNCVAGEPGWESKPWGTLSCKAECFDK